MECVTECVPECVAGSGLEWKRAWRDCAVPPEDVARKRRLLHQKSVWVTVAMALVGRSKSVMSSLAFGRNLWSLARTTCNCGSSQVCRKDDSCGRPRSSSCWYDSAAASGRNRNGKASMRSICSRNRYTSTDAWICAMDATAADASATDRPSLKSTMENPASFILSNTRIESLPD